jgi:hypothetical protein
LLGPFAEAGAHIVYIETFPGFSNHRLIVGRECASEERWVVLGEFTDLVSCASIVHNQGILLAAPRRLSVSAMSCEHLAAVM